MMNVIFVADLERKIEALKENYRRKYGHEPHTLRVSREDEAEMSAACGEDGLRLRQWQTHWLRLRLEWNAEETALVEPSEPV